MAKLEGFQQRLSLKQPGFTGKASSSLSPGKNSKKCLKG